MTDSPLEQPAPYGGPATTPARGSSNPADDEGPTPGRSPRRVRTHHLRQWKTSGERFAMLTCYDALTAQLFDAAGIDVLLVGDSAANTVHGHRTSLPVTTDELLPLARAVASHAERALVMGDLPFGSYQASPEQAYATAARFMKEAGVAAIKLEGGATMAPQIERLSRGGIPVCAHIGFTPQYEHALGGYRVQGRGDAAARVLADARAVQDAGAFAVLLEMVPTEVAAQVTRSVDIPTIGIGAGPVTDGQVLVWQDALGLTTGRLPRFVKQFADLRTVMTDAARAYAAEVRDGTFPASEHTF